MEEDNKDLTGQTRMGTDSEETKKAAKKESTAKTTSKAKTTETSPAPSTGLSPATAKEPEAEKKDDAMTKLAREYKKLYPGNKTFHITSDKQVFLEGSKGLADLHQRGLKGGTVTSITIN